MALQTLRHRQFNTLSLTERRGFHRQLDLERRGLQGGLAEESASKQEKCQDPFGVH
jgi:hypothetical protein